MMSARVITPPTMDLNRDIGSQNMPDAATGQPSVVALPEAGEGGAAGLPESAGVPISTHHLIPSPAVSPNSSMMGPTTELVLSTHIRSVSRCLFGSPDPTSRAFAQERVREIRQNDKTKYNFDFEEEIPLKGRFQWEPVRVAPPTTTSSNTGSGGYAPKAYALSRLPYLSGAMVDRGMISPPPRTINNNLPPARQLYFQPDIPEREPLLIARPALSPCSTYTTTAIKSTVTSIHQSSERVPPVDPSKFLPSPDASSCSSEDFVNDAEMELEDMEDEEVPTSVDSSSTEDDLKQVHDHQSVQSISSPSTSPSATNVARVIQHDSSTGSGYSNRQYNSSSCSTSSTTSSRRTKSVSSSSSSPSASPSSPTSSQPPITRFMPQRKRPASTPTTKAASDSAPKSSAASNENKRAAL